jgi:hypothetical protein
VLFVELHAAGVQSLQALRLHTDKHPTVKRVRTGKRSTVSQKWVYWMSIVKASISLVPVTHCFICE